MRGIQRRMWIVSGLLLVFLSACGSDHSSLAANDVEVTQTSSSTVAVEASTSSETDGADATTISSSTSEPVDTSTIDSPSEISIYENLTDCLPEGTHAIETATEAWFGDGDGPSHDPQAIRFEVPKGPTLTVRTAGNPLRGDFDGDGVLDTLQFVDLWDPSGDMLAEGIRVCGTSRALNPYFVSPSNGNFGALVVPFETGQAGIVNRGPIDRVLRENVWLFDTSGDLIPPYARVTQKVTLEEPFVRAIDELEGDFDGDGKSERAQFVDLDDPATQRRAYVLRVCETDQPIDDYVWIGVNKPMGDPEVEAQAK